MSAGNDVEPRARRWKRKLIHEMLEYYYNLVFVAFFLVAFAWYRRLVLASYGIEFTSYWVPLVEAAVLAKVIMIGDALRMGRGFRNLPLVIPAIYRTVVFSLMVVLLSVTEQVVRALFLGKSVADGIAVITSKGTDELLSRCVLMIVALFPFFAMKEVERIFGVARIRRMFFRHAEPEASASGHAGSSMAVD